MNKGQWNCYSSNSLKLRDLMEVRWRNSFEDLTQNSTKKNIKDQENLVRWSLIYTHYLWGGIRTWNFFPEIKSSFWCISNHFRLFLVKKYTRTKLARTIIRACPSDQQKVRTFYRNGVHILFEHSFFRNLLEWSEKHFRTLWAKIREKMCEYYFSLVRGWRQIMCWHRLDIMKRHRFFIECVLINCNATKRKWQTEKNQ